MEAQEHLEAIVAILEQVYGSPRHDNKDDPLDELIYIKLSQQTNAPKFRSMYETLQQRYPGWFGLGQAPLDELEAILHPGGLYRQRAHNLKAMATQIAEDNGRLDLSWLRQRSAPEAIAYLSSLPGVGVKTAYCVAMYSLGHDVLPVDVHVQRISERLGLLPKGLSDEKKHQLLNALVPPGKRYSYHVNCVSHGREICRKVPKCSKCCIQDFCAFFRARSQADVETKG
ncbi:MAG: endonuclease III [Anaerolineae bacterium]|nr:endonuclease III [Anaerolineae bacterium]